MVKCVERTHDVAPVDADVSGEVVAGACGHAHKGHVVCRCGGRHRGLGSVTSRHADHLGADSHLRQGQRPYIIAGRQDHRDDPPRAAFGHQVEALGLSPASFRVHEQDSTTEPWGHD